MVQHLPTLLPILLNNLNDRKLLVRSITCWCIGRYAVWSVHPPQGTDLAAHRAQFFRPILENVFLLNQKLLRLWYCTKKVQEAACLSKLFIHPLDFQLAVSGARCRSRRLEENGLLYLQPSEHIELQYNCVAPLIHLYWAIKNNQGIQIPFMRNSKEEAIQPVHVLMAMMWAAGKKPNVKRQCGIQLSDLFQIRRRYIYIKFPPVHEVRAVKGIDYEKLEDMRTDDCIAFWNSDGADAVILSTPMIILKFQENQEAVLDNKAFTEERSGSRRFYFDLCY